MAWISISSCGLGTKSRQVGWCSWVVMLLLLLPGVALAWKPYTHNVIANFVLQEVIATGQVTINGRSYPVRPDVVVYDDTAQPSR